MRFILITVCAVLSLSAVGIQPSAAQSRGPTPWCIENGANGFGTMDCTYWTLQQCRESASGAGGFCVQNPRYIGPRRDQPPRRGYYDR